MQIENGIQSGDPTPWGIERDSAGYMLREVQQTFARYSRALTKTNSSLPENNRNEMLTRANTLESEAYREVENQNENYFFADNVYK